jgi:AhpD family alkylhydroperoxidase
MMQDSMIKQALHEYKEGIGKMSEKMPDVIHSYNEFTKVCFQEGTLSQKHKHLIGLALGVYSNDEYCIIFHTKEAMDQGATEEEILEAVAVSAAFGGGMAMSQSATLVQEAIEEFRRLH